MTLKPTTTLESFPNPTPARPYTICMRLPEFTCLCPKTGQPDFATLLLEYVPAKLCIELKSLKNYIWAFRNVGAFHEAVTNQILDELVAAIAPLYMRLTADFNVRGGIYTSIIVEHRQPGWTPLTPVVLPHPAAPTGMLSA
ncbi:MAG: preQ(1) synthase [Gammaproteobacteria bacterium]